MSDIAKGLDEELFQGVMPYPEETSMEVLAAIQLEMANASILAQVEVKLSHYLKLTGREHLFEAYWEVAKQIHRSFVEKLRDTPHVAFWGAASSDCPVGDETTEAFVHQFCKLLVRRNISILHGGAATGWMGKVDEIYLEAMKEAGTKNLRRFHILLQFSRSNPQSISEMAIKESETAVRSLPIPKIEDRNTMFQMGSPTQCGIIVLSGGAGTLAEVSSEIVGFQLRKGTLSHRAGEQFDQIAPLIIIDRKVDVGDGKHLWQYDSLLRFWFTADCGKGLRPNTLSNTWVLRPEKPKAKSTLFEVPVYPDDPEGPKRPVLESFESVEEMSERAFRLLKKVA